jgi:hypothetical protein
MEQCDCCSKRLLGLQVEIFGGENRIKRVSNFNTTLTDAGREIKGWL